MMKRRPQVMLSAESAFIAMLGGIRPGLAA